MRSDRLYLEDILAAIAEILTSDPLLILPLAQILLAPRAEVNTWDSKRITAGGGRRWMSRSRGRLGGAGGRGRRPRAGEPLSMKALLGV